jgi:hypothetical protein
MEILPPALSHVSPVKWIPSLVAAFNIYPKLMAKGQVELNST